MDYGDFSTHWLSADILNDLRKLLHILNFSIFLYLLTEHLVFNCICLVFVLLTRAF